MSRPDTELDLAATHKALAHLLRAVNVLAQQATKAGVPYLESRGAVCAVIADSIVADNDPAREESVASLAMALKELVDALDMPVDLPPG